MKMSQKNHLEYATVLIHTLQAAALISITRPVHSNVCNTFFLHSLAHANVDFTCQTFLLVVLLQFL